MRVRKPYHTGFTGRVRDAAKRFGEFTYAAITNALNVQNYKDSKNVKKTVKALRKAGEIAPVKAGLFRYVAKEYSGRSTDVMKKLYRAMHVKGCFTPNEIITLSDADKSYSYRVIHRLVRNGDVEKAGIRKNEAGRNEDVYRVKHKDDFYLKYIARK